MYFEVVGEIGDVEVIAKGPSVMVLDERSSRSSDSWSKP